MTEGTDAVNQDDQHLRLLTIFHYVLAAIIGLTACIPIIHLVVGALMIGGAFDKGSSSGPPEPVGWLFVGIAATVILLGWAAAVLTAMAGRFLAARRNYTFCMVVAGLLCLIMPMGTVLGVFTIVVLMRESVRAQFGLAAG